MVVHTGKASKKRILPVSPVVVDSEEEWTGSDSDIDDGTSEAEEGRRVCNETGGELTMRREESVQREVSKQLQLARSRRSTLCGMLVHSRNVVEIDPLSC